MQTINIINFYQLIWKPNGYAQPDADSVLLMDDARADGDDGGDGGDDNIARRHIDVKHLYR